MNKVQTKIDLHIHSNCSDGVLSAREIIDEAIINNVTTISICDHDNTFAYTQEILAYAKQNNKYTKN